MTRLSHLRRLALAAHALLLLATAAMAAPTAKGVVFHDRDGDGRFGDGDKPLADVRVSNGEQVVSTDRRGRFELPHDDDTVFFVIKPRGWRSPLSDDFLPRFYYIHKPAGSPVLDYAGIAPTGPLPDRLEFPLYRTDEPETFKAILFADTQPRNVKEVEYIAHDVVEELVGTDALFGVTLGDVVFDDLNVFEPLNGAIGLIGIPWHNVVGNHDINFDAASDYLSNETFRRTYGPPYYSFDYGPVHFIVLDDVEWIPAHDDERGRYRGGLDEAQLTFIRNDLEAVPDDQLIVLFMHIPLVDVGNREQLYRLIEDRPFTLSVSGHTHWQAHRFIDAGDGWRGAEPHHHVINVTVSGSWWSGAPDERGIPHTTMRDGAPNGYSIVTFDGSEYSIEFKAASRPADYQMNLFAPEVVEMDKTAGTEVIANVFGGSPRSIVEMRVDEEGPWVAMEHVEMKDPYFQLMKDLEGSDTPPPGRRLPGIRNSDHIWTGALPRLSKGSHRIEVRTRDMFGQEYTGYRVIRVR